MDHKITKGEKIFIITSILLAVFFIFYVVYIAGQNINTQKANVIKPKRDQVEKEIKEDTENYKLFTNIE